ncbi:hypothetical protein FOA52_008514 [Chlamydomonas sp. UWO 241]|nr:hypothetical protein FOA52_008514 [Chlamydomonas sp. UWO 241]
MTQDSRRVGDMVMVVAAAVGGAPGAVLTGVLMRTHERRRAGVAVAIVEDAGVVMTGALVMTHERDITDGGSTCSS